MANNFAGSPFEVVQPEGYTQRRLTDDECPHGCWVPDGYSFEVDGDTPDDVDDTEFDTFTVRITHPMRHDLSQEVLRDLLHRGAFNGISDGREDEHGPVFIKDFEMLPSVADANNQRQSAEAVPNASLSSAGFGLAAVLGVALLSLVLLASAIGGSKRCRRAPYCAVAATESASHNVLIEDSTCESPIHDFT